MPMAVHVGAGQRVRREVHAANDGENLLNLLRRGVAVHDDKHGGSREIGFINPLCLNLSAS